AMLPHRPSLRQRGSLRLNGVADPGYCPRLPEPYTGSKAKQVLTLKDVPTPEALAEMLHLNGLDTSTWGQGNTKEVSKFWKEMKLDEAGLEIWERPDGQLAIVRVTHVLRAKVTSEECHGRDIWLFNTWQQYGDGRKRTRNGLLSEKLTISEMPLQAHLHEVCQRAVTEEEMQRVVDAECHIGPGNPAPQYDTSYTCPLQVVREVFVDHTVEIEESKSYPGLKTVYHLYTVDIICTGLPTVNFNTLEFEHADEGGPRGLKYIHAWVWLKWPTIQRYLLEGSDMKERMVKGSFKCSSELEDWLSQFDLGLEEWGVGDNDNEPVSELFKEVEEEKAQLELWGRQDGVPLLMRVVHVLQVMVKSATTVGDKFIFQESKQRNDGRLQPVNRLLAKKLDTTRLPFDGAFFMKATREAIKEQLAYTADVHFQLSPDKLPRQEDYQPANITTNSVEFCDHRFDLGDSPSFKGITTMYHLYTVHALCHGLPTQDFASLNFSGSKVDASVWRWVTWQHTLDILHARAGQLLERDKTRTELLASARSAGAQSLEQCRKAVERMSKKSKDPDLQMLQNFLNNIEKQVISPLELVEKLPDLTTVSAAERLPPCMVSALADKKLVTDDFLDE
ncbi:unnamed protein product, partial [Polarella glacialis]